MGRADRGSCSFFTYAKQEAHAAFLELKNCPSLTVGFALMWAWTRLVFGTSSFDASLLFLFDSALPSILLVLSNAIAYLFIGVLFKAKGVIPSGRAYLALIAIAMVLGAALCVFSNVFFAASSSGLLPGCLGAVLLGFAVSFMYVEWGRILGLRGPRSALVHACVGICGSALVLTVLGVAPLAIQYGYALCAPAAIMAVVAFQEGAFSKKQVDYGKETECYIPWRLVVTAAVAGVAFGVAFEVDGLGNYIEASFARNALTLVAAAVLVMCSAVLLKMDFNQLVYRVGMPVMAAGMVMYCMTDFSVRAGGFVFSVGYLLIDLIIWVLFAYIIKYQKVSPNWIVALVTGSLLLGRSMGIFCCGFAGNSGIVSDAKVAFVLLVAYAVMLCAVLMVNKRNIRIGWGAIHPADGDVSNKLAEACCLIGEDYGLTPREVEVCTLLARGYSRDVVAQTLVLSRETVRTHTANIFKKLDVHSHQELIKKAEERLKEIEEE